MPNLGDAGQEFGGNETFVASRNGSAPVEVTPVTQTSTTPRQIASYGIANFVQVGATNVAVVPATPTARIVKIQNVGMVPVWITNGQALAPNGWRIGAGESWEMETDQAVYLCGLAGSPSQLFPVLKAFVAVTG